MFCGTGSTAASGTAGRGRESTNMKFHRYVIFAFAVALLSLPEFGEAAEGDHKSGTIDLFQTSDRCFACHNGLATSAGEDISIGFSWRPTMMANSARDPYWQAGVRRETIDHPEPKAAIEDECSMCHMPMARYQAKFEGKEGEVFSHLEFGADEPLDRLAHDGVSCSLCHQITKDKLGTRESLVGGFVIDTTQAARASAPSTDRSRSKTARRAIMRTSSGGYKPTESDHVRQVRTLRDVPHADYESTGSRRASHRRAPRADAVPGMVCTANYKDKQSCQNCHMPAIEEPVRVTQCRWDCLARNRPATSSSAEISSCSAC